MSALSNHGGKETGHCPTPHAEAVSRLSQFLHWFAGSTIAVESANANCLDCILGRAVAYVGVPPDDLRAWVAGASRVPSGATATA